MYSYSVRSDGQLDALRRPPATPPPAPATPPPAPATPPPAPATPSPKPPASLDSEVLLIGALMFLIYTSGGKKPDWLLLAALGYLLL